MGSRGGARVGELGWDGTVGHRMDVWAQRNQNLSHSGSNRHLRRSIVLLLSSLVATVVMGHFGLHAEHRALLFVPVFIGSLELFRGLYGSCFRRARRGERETLSGIKPVFDPMERQRARKKARQTLLHATVVALFLTLALVVLG